MRCHLSTRPTSASTWRSGAHLDRSNHTLSLAANGCLRCMSSVTIPTAHFASTSNLCLGHECPANEFLRMLKTKISCRSKRICLKAEPACRAPRLTLPVRPMRSVPPYCYQSTCGSPHIQCRHVTSCLPLSCSPALITSLCAVTIRSRSLRNAPHSPTRPTTTACVAISLVPQLRLL